MIILRSIIQSIIIQERKKNQLLWMIVKGNKMVSHFQGQRIQNQQLLPKRLQVLKMATKRQKLAIYYESFGYKSISISKSLFIRQRSIQNCAFYSTKRGICCIFQCRSYVLCFIAYCKCMSEFSIF